MNPEQLELLNALRFMTTHNPYLLTDKAFDVYDKLAEEADNLNIIW